MMNFTYTDENGQRWDVEFGFDSADGNADADLHCRINGMAVGLQTMDQFLEALPDAALDWVAQGNVRAFPGFSRNLSAN